MTHDLTLGALLNEARRRLAHAKVEDPGLEARILVEHFTGTSRTDAIAAPERPVEQGRAEAVLEAVERRLAGMPVYRILGYREFYGLKLLLSAETLEPRPDTEALVELVLPEVRRIAQNSGRCHILDLGTGTGAIVLALLSVIPEARAVGADISPDALATAHRNADINGCAERFTTLRSDWFQNVQGRFDLIVSNPPYIPSAEVKMLPREVREHDPSAALDGGPDGLEPYRLIAAGGRRHLTEEGLIAVETGYDQRDAVQAIFAEQGYQVLQTAQDLGGRDRAILFKAHGKA